MDQIYIISGIIIAVLILGVFLFKGKTKDGKKNNLHIGGGEPLTDNSNTADNGKSKEKKVNFVDASSSASGIIEGQKKKERLAEEANKKPIGWVHTKSYDEDIKEASVTEVAKQSVPEVQTPSVENKPVEKKEKPSILVVDDSITVLKLVGVLLGKGNYDFITKDNGNEALEYLKSTNSLPDLIITDIEMPIMTGTELINHIKKEKKLSALPILILSSNTEPHIGLLQDGLINGIIQKPFDKENFMNQIKYLINN